VLGLRGEGSTRVSTSRVHLMGLMVNLAPMLGLERNRDIP
jgi:hypothetical protein